MFNTTYYEDTICGDIGKYYCELGRLPKAIFISRSLFEVIMGSYSLKVYDTHDGVVHMFHGIEMKLYPSDKMEYYLVANGRVLD